MDLPEFPHMTYADAMDRYGSDKPDLRIPLELVSIDDLMQQVEFKVFRGPADDPAGRVAALKVTGGASISRKDIDDYTKYVSIFGARGLAWIKVNDIAAGVEGLQSPILKFMPDDIVAQMMQRLGAANGDIIFFGADRARVVNEALGACGSRWRKTWAWWRRAGRPCGWWTSRCLKRMQMDPGHRCITPLPRPHATRNNWRPAPGRRCPVPMIWC